MRQIGEVLRLAAQHLSYDQIAQSVGIRACLMIPTSSGSGRQRISNNGVAHPRTTALSPVSELAS
jgi:hypothetical protein